MGNAPSKPFTTDAHRYNDYGAICPNSPSFDEEGMFEDIICEPLVTSDRKTSFRSRKSWDSVHLSDSKRISFDSAFDAAKGALDKMRPTKSSYSKISGEPKQLIGVNW